MENVGKLIATIGVVLVVIGLIVWVAAGKLSWFGHLPGDIYIERPNFRFYMPITTMILLSIALSVVMWLAGKFFR
ncbi:MAG TPA: DUF2905 domain-containing protein [Candidatus Entotheonella sp.]|jgi:uncharacterized protein HemY